MVDIACRRARLQKEQMGESTAELDEEEDELRRKVRAAVGVAHRERAALTLAPFSRWPIATGRQEEELVKYLERTAQEREEKAKAREQKQQKKLAKKAAALAQGSGPDGIIFPPRRSAEVAAKYRLPLALDHEVLEVRLYWVPLLQPDTTIALLPFGVPILKRYAHVRKVRV